MDSITNSDLKVYQRKIFKKNLREKLKMKKLRNWETLEPKNKYFKNQKKNLLSKP